MANKILLVFLAFDFLFACFGALILGVVLMTRASQETTQTVSFVAENLLLNSIPLKTAGLNAIFIFAAFLISIPAVALPNRRIILRIFGYAVVLCALFSLVIGLVIWFDTLQTKTNLAVLWAQQTPHVQSLLQQRFQCCGYTSPTSPPFVVDNTCTNVLVAASLGGCEAPFTTFTNNFLDLPFTAIFGIAGVDVMLLLSVACLFKDRKERERFHRIDAKSDIPI